MTFPAPMSGHRLLDQLSRLSARPVTRDWFLAVLRFLSRELLEAALDASLPAVWCCVIGAAPVNRRSALIIPAA